MVFCATTGRIEDVAATLDMLKIPIVFNRVKIRVCHNYSLGFNFNPDHFSTERKLLMRQ
jgi:hypothetical protein